MLQCKFKRSYKQKSFEHLSTTVYLRCMGEFKEGGALLHVPVHYLCYTLLLCMKNVLLILYTFLVHPWKGRPWKVVIVQF